MNKNSTEVLAVIRKNGKATMQQIRDELRGLTCSEVENAIKTLRKSKKVQNISDQAHVAIYTADMTAVSPYRPSKERDPMTGKPLRKCSGPVTPGQLVSKMSGIYVPTRTQPMRPGALDHEACMSRRADSLVPYSGQYIATGVTEK
jgi:hypothetical protein